MDLVTNIFSLADLRRVFDMEGVNAVTEVAKVYAVAAVASELVKKMGRLMEYDVRKSDVEKLRKKIELLKRSIEEADGKLEEAIPEKVWVKQMREVAEFIEDVFDEHVTDPTVQRGFAGYLNISSGRSSSQNLASDMEKINGLLLGIKERAEIKHSPDSRALHKPYICRSLEFLETTGRALKELRPRISSSEFCRSTVVIVGPGGIGKSVLAKWVYEVIGEEFDVRVWVTVPRGSSYYKLLRLMEVQISREQSQTPQEVNSLASSDELSSMDDSVFLAVRFKESVKMHDSELGLMRDDEFVEANSSVFDSMSDDDFFNENSSELGLMRDDESVKTSSSDFDSMRDDERVNATEELMIALRRSLQSKRYLVVFDDVWGEEIRRVVRDVLPDDNEGGRVIITTRSDTVAAAYKETSSDYIHRVKPMSEPESLELFHRLPFSYEAERLCYPESEKLTLEIVRMCEGLPCAIVAIAQVLSTKEKVPQEWIKLLEDFSLKVEIDGRLRSLITTLALSFLDLPSHLKPCFLYFSIIPRRSPVPNDQLYKLWIAEGFVQEKIGKTLEEVAEEYLNELIARNLVQECEGFYGVEKFSKVNSMMYEVARIKANERSFCQIWDGKNSSFRGDSRRLSITHAKIEQVLDTQEEFRVRSVFISNDNVTPEISALLALFERYKLITLLTIEDTPIEIIPKEVGNLICLKYLSLKNTKVSSLPKSVIKLQKLQTLNLSGTLLVDLPMEIFKLQNLRHLLASRCDNKINLDSAKAVRIEAGIGLLTKLQTLMTVEAHLSGRGVINQLKRLRQLRSLSVSRLTTELARALCVCIKAMKHLESLRLHSMNSQILDLQAISTPPPRLERLVLKGLIQKFPNWVLRLENLKVLCLSLSRLADDPLRNICVLPYLETLWLYRAYEGERLHFREGDFQSLKLLVLRDLQGLKEVEIEEGSLPLLEELRIGPSPLLNEVPFGINHLTNLKVVSFYDMPKEFVLRMKPEQGSEYWKVKHVESVFIWYRDEGRRYVSYKLHDSSDFCRHDSRLSLCYSDDEEDSAVTSNLQWNDISRASFASDQFSFFTDDVEE